MGTENIGRHTYRKVCLNEKGEYCHLCGSEENIVVHHIDGDRENNDLDNLLPVCRGCHIKIHFGSDYQQLHDQLPDESRFGVVASDDPKVKPAIDFAETERRDLYPTERTWQDYEDTLVFEVRRELREDGYTNIEKRELHEATLRVAIENPDIVVEEFRKQRNHNE